MWPFILLEPAVENAQLDDVLDLADIHASTFAHHWSADELAQLMMNDNICALKCRRPATMFRPLSRQPKGFVVARLAADEAEILTVAVAPDARRLGLGRRLMQALIDTLYADGLHYLFLEVDESNDAAIGLYKRLGFLVVGERKGYYAPVETSTGEQGNRPTALVMRVDLR